MRNKDQQPNLPSIAWLTKSKQFLASFPSLAFLSSPRKVGQRPPSPIKTPTVLQMEAVECGAAALAILLSYYGRIVPLAQLRQECGVSRDGSTAANILKVAKRYGLTAKGFKKGLNALQEVRCPYIVFWNFNHFLVVEGWCGDRVYLNDPAVGRRTVSLQEFDESYTGIALVMEPSADFRRGGRKSNLWMALYQRLQDSTGAIAYCILAGFLLVIPTLAITAFTQVFIDRILVQGQQDWLQPLLIGILLTTLLRGFLTDLQLRYLRRLKVKLSVAMSSQFLWHLLRLPTSFYAQRYAGEIAYRTGLNDKVADVLSGRLATTAIDVVMIAFYAIVMTQYDPGLALLGVGLVTANLIALGWVSRQRVDANLRLGLEYGKVAGVVIAGLQTIETLKSSALESDFFSRWSGYYTRAINTHQELGIQNQHLNILTSLLSVLASLLLLIFGGLRVMEGSLSVGMLVALQSLMQSFLEPVNRLVGLGSTLQELEGDLSRLEDVLGNATDNSRETSDLKRTQAQKVAVSNLSRSENQSAPTKFEASSRLHGQVELRNVTFGYSPVDVPLIQDLSLKVEPGQRVAFIGGSGSGKSTIAKLIGGLYQPWSGEILFDGIPLAEVSQSRLTRSRAVVEQDIFLFAGSVRQNLTLWDGTVPDRHLIQACQDAAIHDVVVALPGGYDAELMEGGGNLSGGQRQRLEIARALVNNPSILILDEATSALDAETERMIDQNLRRRGCTCMIVAHRLSTIRDCDEILVFDRGKVVQRGTHEELCRQEGAYLHLIQTDLES